MFDNIKVNSKPVYPVAPIIAILILLFIDILSYITVFKNNKFKWLSLRKLKASSAFL